MRKTLMAVTLVFIAAWACAQDAAPAVGSIVAARWSDGSWYRGKITAIKAGKCTVSYDDGDSATLDRKDVRLIPAAPKVKKGQHVFALWEDDGAFYLATVREVTKTGIVAAWDDGGEAAEVAFGYFTTDISGLDAATGSSSGGKTITLWYGGSRVGEVEPDGRVWMGGSMVGEIESGGRVWKDGSVVGEVEASGAIWQGGSRVGEVEPDGRVWKDGSAVGQIEPGGRIWKDGSVVGEAPGLSRAWAAAIYFFFFIDQ